MTDTTIVWTPDMKQMVRNARITGESDQAIADKISNAKGMKWEQRIKASTVAEVRDILNKQDAFK